MILKETLDNLALDVQLGKAKTEDILNLIREYRTLVAWEERSFEEVDLVIDATGELDEFIDIAQGFPKSTIEGLKLCKQFGEYIREEESLKQRSIESFGENNDC